MKLHHFAEKELGIVIDDLAAGRFLRDIAPVNTVKSGRKDRGPKEAVRINAAAVPRRGFARLSRSAAIISGRLWVYQQVENFFRPSSSLSDFASRAAYG
jgi:hypothetical protein